MQIKIMMIHNYTPSRMAGIKIQATVSLDREELEPSYIAEGDLK